MRRDVLFLSCTLAVSASILRAQDSTQADTILDANKPSNLKNMKSWKSPHDSNWVKTQCLRFYDYQTEKSYQELTECYKRYGLGPPTWYRRQRVDPNAGNSDAVNASIVVYYKVTEQNDAYWRFAWRLPLKNNSDSPARFAAIIKFLDAEGFEVADDRAYGLSVGPREEREFTGATLIRLPAAATVTRARVEFEP